MSSQSLAALRKSASGDLQRLADEHLQHDLRQSDRDTLEAAARKVSRHAIIGSLVGLGVGVFLAYKIHTTRNAIFNAFRAMEKPTAVQFVDGRTEPIPDITLHLQPTRLGDAATYFFFSIGGLFLGGETGFLTGSASAKRTIIKDPETRARIEKAFQKFKADVLKKELQQLEDGGSSFRLF